jgi:hypothetical protein
VGEWEKEGRKQEAVGVRQREDKREQKNGIARVLQEEQDAANVY